MANQLNTQRIDYLQRNGIQPKLIPEVPNEKNISKDRRVLLHIKGIGRIKKEISPNAEKNVRLPTEQLLTGLYNYKIPVVFIIRGDLKGISIEIGTWSSDQLDRNSNLTLDKKKNIIISLLRSLYPSVDYSITDPRPLDLPLSGYVMGNPTVKEDDPVDISLQIDKLVRSMVGMKWACLIFAEPVMDNEISNIRNSINREMLFIQQAVQTGTPKSIADYYTKLLETLLESLTTGQSIGCWRTAVYLLGDEESYYRLTSVWKGIFTGEKSLPETLRIWDDKNALRLAEYWSLQDQKAEDIGGENYKHPYQYLSLLNSMQLTSYIHFPNLETIGFNVNTVPDFDAVPQEPKNDNVINLGTIIHRSRLTDVKYSIPIQSLTRHAFVSGVTGAGKTNTIFHILQELSKTDIPFLIIEPAKTEYRSLANDPIIGKKLQIFTLGNENVSPFRLNPFEVPKDIAIGIHLDMLRSVFNVSFGMWNPLPQVLEKCLYEIYKDRGWDITSDGNHRLDQKADRTLAFPTLTDLQRKVEEVVWQLGYDDEVSNNIHAALTTRINSLRIGGKGRMLDVSESLSMEEWLSKPTILELESMGDDDDKAFLMGLLFIRLVEYRRLNKEKDNPIHFLVIEEAHRLLTNASSQQKQEESNPRGKAVESFSNMLSEVRAYGQGIIIADQVPVKLAPDVIKNTNLKIAHRIVSLDDRTVLAGSMNMTENQTKVLSILEKGQATVFAEGDDVPIMISVDKVDLKDEKMPDDYIEKQMSPLWGKYTKLFPQRIHCDKKLILKENSTSELAKVLIETEEFQRDFVRLVISVTENNESLDASWQGLVLRVKTLMNKNLEESMVLKYTIAYASEWFANRRGSQAGWSYSETSDLKEKLKDMLLAKLENKKTELLIAAFRKTMLDLHQRSFEPFVGCDKICKQDPLVCLYRFAVSDILGKNYNEYNDSWTESYLEDRSSADNGLQNTWKNCEAVSSLLVSPDPKLKETSKRIGLCFSQQILSEKFPEIHAAILDDLLKETTNTDDEDEE